MWSSSNNNCEKILGDIFDFFFSKSYNPGQNICGLFYLSEQFSLSTSETEPGSECTSCTYESLNDLRFRFLGE